MRIELDGARVDLRSDILSRCLHSILARPVRTALTAFGIGFGVAAALQLVGASGEAGAAPQRRVPAKHRRLTVSHGERESLAWVIKTTPERARRAGLVTVEGRSLGDRDARDQRRVAVIGTGLRAELFGFRAALLQPIEIGERRFTVIGVLEPTAKGSAAAREIDADRAVLLPERGAAGSPYGLRLEGGGEPPA